MTRALGIDVGSTHIRIAEMESSGRKRRLMGLYELTREKEMSAGQQLRQFFEQSGFQADRIALGTSTEPLVIRSFNFPFSNTKKVEGAIRSEFEDTLPFDIDDHILEIRPMGKRGKSFFYIAGLMPRAALEGLDQLAEESGLMLHSYFPDTEALSQLALNQNLPIAQEDVSYGICDFGHVSTKLSLLKGSRPKFLNKKAKEAVPPQILEIRNLHRGGSELMDWIREKNVLSQEDAQQWLLHRAEIRADDDAQSLTREISDEIKNALRPVIVELYQTLQAFKSRTGSLPLAIYMTGGLSGLKGLAAFLSHELHVPFRPWPIFEGFDTHNLPLTLEKERHFAVAVALAHKWTSDGSQGWLNFKRATAQKKLLSSLVESFQQPEVKRIAWGLSLSVLGLWLYNMGASLMLGQQYSKTRSHMISEFRRMDRELGRRAQNFADDPQRAEEIFEKEKRKRLQAQNTTATPQSSRSRSDMLMDLSEVLPTGSTLKEVELARAVPPNVSLSSIFEMAGGGDVKKLQETLKKSLARKGYAGVSLETQASSNKLFVLKATWKGEAAK